MTVALFSEFREAAKRSGARKNKKKTRMRAQVSQHKNTTVLIFDQCPLFAEGLRETIASLQDLEVIGIVSDPNEAMQKVREQCPDIVCIDLDTGNTGISLLSDMKALPVPPRCLMLITDGGQPALMAAIRLQADGFLTKRLSAQQFESQIAAAAKGEMVISDSLTAALAVSLRNVPIGDESHDISRLSPREVDVLYCIANGMSNKQISEQLDISNGTVKVHVKHVLKKLGFSTRVEAALWANDSGHRGPVPRKQSFRSA